MVAHTSESLSKLNKEDLVRLALDYQHKQDSLLNKINEDLTELRRNYTRLESELQISKSVTTLQQKKIVALERQCWSNEQYSRRECLEISGIPDNTENLEKTVLEVFSKIDVDIQPANIEACHWLKSERGGKKAIVKFSKRKDVDRVRKAKRKLKTTDLNSIGITNPVYVNDSLCKYYKYLWSKCKKFLNGRYIHSFWISNGTIRIKLHESSTPKNISHFVDLEEMFPGHPLLADDQNQG